MSAGHKAARARICEAKQYKRKIHHIKQNVAEKFWIV